MELATGALNQLMEFGDTRHPLPFLSRQGSQTTRRFFHFVFEVSDKDAADPTRDDGLYDTL